MTRDRLQIISGGQTGVDQTALLLAHELGYPTGGTAPLGWRTDEGPAPWLANYGLVESWSPQYTVRTVENVRAADLTVWFGDPTSPGGRLTKRVALAKDPQRWIENPTDDELRQRLHDLTPTVVNVAGNRKRTHPEAAVLADDILREVLSR